MGGGAARQNEVDQATRAAAKQVLEKPPPSMPGYWERAADDRRQNPYLFSNVPTIVSGDGDPIEVPVTVEGPGALALQYAFVDPAAGEVLATGPAEGADGSFTVTIDASIAGALFPGLYQLFLLASSDAIAEVAESRVDLQVGV